MALRNLSVLQRNFSIRTSTATVTKVSSRTFLQKNRKYANATNPNTESGNANASKSCKPNKGGKKEPDRCDYKVCNKKPKKKSFWRRFFESDEKDLPPIECCRLRQKEICDPDLSEFGGKAYRTCGPAYIIQKDIIPTEEHETTKEEAILRKIEAPLGQKDSDGDDPLPKFKGAEMRMLEMADKRLHPIYKQHYTIKKQHAQEVRKKLFKKISWPIDMHEIPALFNIKKDTLEKKNMEYVEFKRIEPPRQLIEATGGMDNNMGFTLERTMQPPLNPAEFEEKVATRRPPETTSQAVFDTLNQPETKF